MEPPATIAVEGRRLLALIGAVVAPTTVVAGLAFYFGWRREQAFAGYFGIDQSMLGFSTSDYVLRSVDALFVPFVVVLLVLFGAVTARALLAGHRYRRELTPIIALAGLGAFVVGILLAWGHPVSSGYVYLQALGIGIGALLVADALGHWPKARSNSLAAVRFVAVALALVSAFWATSEYADSRGLILARRLAADLTVNPVATIFSNRNLDINPNRYYRGCSDLVVSKLRGGAYSYRYSGLTLLLRSGGKYFLTPTPGSYTPWRAEDDAVLIVPEDESMRVEFQRGSGYNRRPVEATAAGRLAFTC
jgi:hypothetical protein